MCCGTECLSSVSDISTVFCGDGVLILSSVSDSSTTCAKGDACFVGIEGAGGYSSVAGVVFRDRDRLLVAGSSVARGDVFGLTDCERRPRRLGAAGVAAGLRRLGGIATTAAVVDGAIRSEKARCAPRFVVLLYVSGNALVSLTETEVCI